MTRARTATLGQFPVRLVLSVVAAAVSVTMIMALVPVGADRDDEQEKIVREARKLANNEILQNEFPQLAAFGRAIANDDLQRAKRIAQDIVDHPGRTNRQVKAVLAADPDDDGPGDDSAIGAFGRLAVVSPIGALIRPQISISAFVCPILQFLKAQFGAFFGGIFDALLAAFGCNPPPPPTTTTTTTTTTTSTSTTSTTSTTTTTTTIPRSTTTFVCRQGNPCWTFPPTTAKPTTTVPPTTAPTTTTPVSTTTVDA